MKSPMMESSRLTHDSLAGSRDGKDNLQRIIYTQLVVVVGVVCGVHK
jgi:hypothetical protein